MTTETSAKDSKPTPRKTPKFVAMNALRYHRQSLIRSLESQTNTHLLCYVSGLEAEINRDDTTGFVDMLFNVPQSGSIDLLLHTPGGQIDVAEKLMALLRAKVEDGGKLRIIVPDFAKSAGTLMVLGADTVIMSDSSELGTIDPQVMLLDGSGQRSMHSVLHYLQAHEEYEKMVRENQTDPAARAMYDKFEPATLNKLKGVSERARKFAENLLKPRGVNYTAIVSELMNINEYPSHGQPLLWETVKNRIGLDNVEYLPQTDEQWRRYWELYCHLRLAIKDDQKIFESSIASLLIDG